MQWCITESTAIFRAFQSDRLFQWKKTTTVTLRFLICEECSSVVSFLSLLIRPIFTKDKGASTNRNPGVTEDFKTLNPFKLQLQYMPHTYNNTNIPEALKDNFMSIWNSNTKKFSLTGGDSETRPVNAYVNFIIKLTDSTPLLVGSIVSYSENDNANVFTIHRFTPSLYPDS